MDLDDVRRLALALPDAHEAPHFDLTSFRVAELLEDAWRRRAPKRVVAAFDASHPERN